MRVPMELIIRHRALTSLLPQRPGYMQELQKRKSFQTTTNFSPGRTEQTIHMELLQSPTDTSAAEFYNSCHI